MLDAKKVIAAVCKEFGGKPKEVLSTPRGKPDVARLRRYAMHVYMSAVPNSTLTSVGVAFDRDRTTVRHAISRVTAELSDLGDDPLGLAKRLSNVMLRLKAQYK